jgi:hypothetical protein
VTNSRQSNGHKVEDLPSRQDIDAARFVLVSMSPREREMLIQFYLLGTSERKLCGEYGIGPEDFSRMRSQALALFRQVRAAEVEPS